MSIKELASIRNVPTRIRRLLEYATEQQRVDSDEALRAATEALRLSHHCKNKILIATSSRTLGLCCYYLRQYEEALEHLESARVMYTKLKDNNSIARSLQNIGVCYVRLGQHEKALNAYQNSQHLFLKCGDDTNRSLVLINLAVIYTTINSQLKAFETYSESLELLEKSNDEFGIATVSSNLGQLFIGMGENDKGLQWMERSLELHRKNNYSRGVGFALREIGLLNQNIGNTDVAREHFHAALKIYQDTEDLPGQAETHLLISELHLQQHDFVSAQADCLTSRTIFTQLHDTQNTARTLNIEGRIFSAQNKHSLAAQSFQEAVKCIVRTDNYAALAEYVYNLAHSLVRAKKLEEAHKLLQRGLKISEEHEILERESFIHDLLSQLFERQHDLLKSLRHARKAQDARRLYEAQLASRKVQDLKYRLDIAKVERDRELMRQQNEQYRAQLENKSKEINASALALAQKNEVISSLKQKIMSISRNGPLNFAENMRELLKQIDQNVRGDKQMEGVTKQLSDFHQEFIAKISSEYRTLTPTEIKICSLLKLNLNTKEIADFLCVSFKSVEVYRARIRKKLGLHEGDNLSAFMMGYDAQSS